MQETLIISHMKFKEIVKKLYQKCITIYFCISGYIIIIIIIIIILLLLLNAWDIYGVYFGFYVENICSAQCILVNFSNITPRWLKNLIKKVS